MILIKHLLLLFILWGCVPMGKGDIDFFESKLFLELFHSSKIEILAIDDFNSQKEITRPPGIWFPLIYLQGIEEMAVDYKNYCLLYKVPFKTQQGELLLLKLNKEKCSLENGQEIASLKNISALSIFYSEKPFRVKENNLLLEPMNLHLWITYKNKGSKLKIPLMNVKKSEKYNRYDNSSQKTMFPGVIFLPYERENHSFETRKSKLEFIGQLSDSYREGSAKICHQVDKKCQNIKAFDCQRCRYGWYEVVDHFCPQGGSKFCAPNKCGEKGQPACIRGRDIIKADLETPCFKGSPFGYCQQGLETYCDESGILTCL